MLDVHVCAQPDLHNGIHYYLYGLYQNHDSHDSFAILGKGTATKLYDWQRRRVFLGDNLLILHPGSDGDSEED